MSSTVTLHFPLWFFRDLAFKSRIDLVLARFQSSKGPKPSALAPPLGSEVSVAVTTYITSLSQSMPILTNPKRPVGPGAVKQLSIKADQADVKQGASLYASRFAECLQKDGQGDKDNPPVWGDQSFNDGAGVNATISVLAPGYLAQRFEQHSAEAGI